MRAMAFSLERALPTMLACKRGCWGGGACMHTWVGRADGVELLEHSHSQAQPLLTDTAAYRHSLSRPQPYTGTLPPSHPATQSSHPPTHPTALLSTHPPTPPTHPHS